MRLKRQTGIGSPLVLVVLGLLCVRPAFADSISNGAALYSAHCASCHGSTPLTSNVGKIYFGRNSRAMVDSSITTVREMNSLRSLFPAGGTNLADVAAYLGNTPGTLTFGSTTVGSASATQTVTVYASLKSASYAISNLAAAVSGDFVRSGGTCGTTVSYGSSCTLSITFSPTASGTRTGQLSLTHNGTLTPIVISLSGTGTPAAQPAIAVNASALTFTDQAVGTGSAARSIVVTNAGASNLQFAGITLSGVAAADFSTGGTCVSSGVLAANATCTVTVVFTPSVVGSRNATLTINSNASNGNAVVSLSGTGVAVSTPGIAFSPTSLAFGDQSVGVVSTARTVTISNPGSGTLQINAISASAGFQVTHNCGSALAAGATCTASVTFQPAVVGAASGAVTVTSNAALSPHTVGLTGNGVLSSPALAWVPAATAISFADTPVGSAPVSKTLTLTNLGPGSVTLRQITLTGPQASDYSLAPTGSCAVNSTLSVNATCTVVIAFQPTAQGARTAILHIGSSGTDPPDVSISGNGTALALPALTVSPSALTFVSTSATAPAGQVVTLTSSGNAVLRVTSVTIGSGRFGVAAAAVNGCSNAPFDLAPGQGCSVLVSWLDTAATSDSGALVIQSNASSGSKQVALSASRSIPGSTDTGISNVGAGGCSISQGESAVDPTLWLTVMTALLVLWLRRRASSAVRRARQSPVHRERCHPSESGEC